MIYNNVLEAVGQTPLIRLNRMVDKDSADILVKFEALNVGGSIKTRTALNMIAGPDSRRHDYRRADKRQSGHRACACGRGQGLPHHHHYARFRQ